MNASTSPRRRQAARLRARVRSSVSGCAVAALTSRRRAGFGLLQLRVDLLVDIGEAAREVLLRPRQVLRDKALERLLVRRADAGYRRRRSVRVTEHIEEGLEARQRVEL